jgi:hypothetical protein
MISSKKRRTTSQSPKSAILRSAYSGFCWFPPVVRRLFEVNSEPHTGARPSVRLCVGLKSPQIGGFVEGRHEIKCPAWSGKTTDGLLAIPLDSYMAAKIMSYEGASKITYHSVFI